MKNVDAMKFLLLALFTLSLKVYALEYELQLENDSVSVARVKIMPHEVIPLHRDAYPQVVVALQGGTITRLEADGSTVDVDFPTEKAVYRNVDPEDELHQSENRSDQVIELIVIQLKNKKQPMDLPELEFSNYVTIVFTVPESHADALREAMWRAGAGKVGHYSGCSFSMKGIARFIPHEGSNPFIGTHEKMEEVVEERIETVCDRAILPYVLEEIKKAHPYEDTVIDIYPIYEAGRKVP